MGSSMPPSQPQRIAPASGPPPLQMPTHPIALGTPGPYSATPSGGHSQPNSATTTSHQQQPFYTTAMPASPFTMSNNMPSMQNGQDNMERRRSGYPEGVPQMPNGDGRAEDVLFSRLERERERGRQANGTNGKQAGGSPLGKRDREDDRGAGYVYPMEFSQMEKERNENAERAEKRARKHHHHRVHPQYVSALIGRRSATNGRSSHVVHHHHHHHPPKEELGYPDDFNSIKRTATPSNGVVRTKAVVASKPEKVPELKINSQALLDSVASFPRNHLGSMVYSAEAKPKPGDSTRHKLIPRFEGRENCTFQVRIPWRYLTKESRRQICEERNLWGTQVYTDDSDPIAVLIHESKIPVVLPEGVDIAQVTPAPAKKGEKALVVPKLQPMKDVLVDILILPGLVEYKGSTRNGLKSRSWAINEGARHDGMSFMVMNVKVVDAGVAENVRSLRKKRLTEWEHVRSCGQVAGVERMVKMAKNGDGKVGAA